MKKFMAFLFFVLFVGGAFAAGENVPTSKSYVDSKLGEKQDIIPANDGAARVLTNTGTAGEYGTRGIYDANGAYATQQNNLVDAASMNAAVQNAIDSEFECVDDNCELVNINGIDHGIQPGDGEWFRAYLNYNTPTKWQYLEDASSSIRIPIKPNIEYKLYWDGDTSESIYRVAFVKTDVNPSASNSLINVYKPDGTVGAVFRSNSQTYPSYVFKVTDSDIKYIVIQIGGSNTAWTSGDFSYLWNRISHLHLIRNIYMPVGQ